MVLGYCKGRDCVFNVVDVTQMPPQIENQEATPIQGEGDMDLSTLEVKVIHDVREDKIADFLHRMSKWLLFYENMIFSTGGAGDVREPHAG